MLVISNNYPVLRCNFRGFSTHKLNSQLLTPLLLELLCSRLTQMVYPCPRSCQHEPIAHTSYCTLSIDFTNVLVVCQCLRYLPGNVFVGEPLLLAPNKPTSLEDFSTSVEIESPTLILCFQTIINLDFSLTKPPGSTPISPQTRFVDFFMLAKSTVIQDFDNSIVKLFPNSKMVCCVLLLSWFSLSSSHEMQGKISTSWIISTYIYAIIPIYSMTSNDQSYL